MENTSVELMFFGRAKGSDEKDIAHAVVKGRCPEPAYVATSRMAIASALTILEEREKLPKGGVFTPGVAFYTSDIQRRLKQMGAIEFEVVSST